MLWFVPFSSCSLFHLQMVAELKQWDRFSEHLKARSVLLDEKEKQIDARDDKLDAKELAKEIEYEERYQKHKKLFDEEDERQDEREDELDKRDLEQGSFDRRVWDAEKALNKKFDDAEEVRIKEEEADRKKQASYLSELEVSYRKKEWALLNEKDEL